MTKPQWYWPNYRFRCMTHVLLLLTRDSCFTNKSKVCRIPRVKAGCSSLFPVMSGQPDAWPVVTFPVVELVFWLVPNYTAWQQRHMFVNSLPEVVSWDWNGPELNFELQVQRFNHYFTRPQFYQWWVHICSTLQDWSWLCNHTVSCWHAMCCLFFLCSVQMCCKYFVRVLYHWLLVTAVMQTLVDIILLRTSTSL